MVNIRINDLPEDDTPNASDFVAIDALSTRKTSIADLVAIGRPLASQAEAEAGTDPSKAMTPLTTLQAIEAQRPSGTTGLALLLSGTAADARGVLGVGVTGEAVFLANTAADIRALLDLEPGTDVQTQSAILQSLADETLTAGDLLYAADATTIANLPIGANGEVLGVNAGALAWQTAGIGDLVAANNLSDVDDGSTAIDNLLTAPSNLKYLTETETTLDFYGGDIVEMFSVSPARKFSIGAGNIEFAEAFTIPAGAQLNVEDGAIFIPTFEPTGLDRATPLVDLGDGVCANYLKLQLDAGINTIRKGFRLGNNAQIGYIEATSADLNNNRTEAGETDLISGAVLIDGDNVRIGQMVLNRFDRGWTVVDSNNVIVGKVRNIETIMGGYVHGTRDLHVLSGYTTGPTDPTEPNSFVNPRGYMTPGANSLVLAGCSDSSFSNWTAIETLEHAVRVGRVASGTSVPNHRLQFNNHQYFRTYGSGFKCDDADDNNIRRILVNGLYTEDIGNNRWWDDPGYSDFSGAVTNNDDNKTACAIRNTQFFRVVGFQNNTSSATYSGQYSLWVERSSRGIVVSPDVQKAKSSNIRIQSGGGNAIEYITVDGGASRLAGGAGVEWAPTNNSDIWRGITVKNIDATQNGTYDVLISARPDGTSPLATSPSKINAFVRGGSTGTVSIAANIAADADFIDRIDEQGTGTATVTFATPGDLSVSYSTQTIVWQREGRWVWVEINLAFTPTFTTASGNFRISGLPYAANGGVNNINIIETDADFTTWNSRIELVPSVVSANSFIEIRGYAAGVGGSPFGTGNLTSGNAHSLKMAGRYRI